MWCSAPCRKAISKHAHFRELCTSFFLDLVSSVCFRDNTPPDRNVVQALLSLLFAEKMLPRDAPQSKWLRPLPLERWLCQPGHV